MKYVGQNEPNVQNPDFLRFCEFCLKFPCNLSVQSAVVSFVFIRVHSWLDKSQKFLLSVNRRTLFFVRR